MDGDKDMLVCSHICPRIFHGDKVQRVPFGNTSQPLHDPIRSRTESLSFAQPEGDEVNKCPRLSSMSPANMQPDVISYNASISALEKTFDRKRLEAFLSEAKGERCMAFCHGLLSGVP